MRSHSVRRAPCFGAWLASLVFALAAGCASNAPNVSGTPDEGRSSDRPCTEMACSDQLSVVLHLAPEDAAVGRHRFDLTIDGRTETCSVDVVHAGEHVDTICGAGIRVSLGATMRGVDMPSPVAGTVMHGEEPVPGQFQARFEFYGTPREVRIVHTPQGRPGFDRTLTPSYAEFRPNGPGCDPVCQAASVELR